VPSAATGSVAVAVAVAVSVTVPAMSGTAVFVRLPGGLRLFRWLRRLRWLRLECRRHVSRRAVLRWVRRVVAVFLRPVSRRDVAVMRRPRVRGRRVRGRWWVRRVSLVHLGQLRPWRRRRGLVLASERFSGRHVLLVSERQAPRRAERLGLRGRPGLDRRRDGRAGADARRLVRRRCGLRAGLGLPRRGVDVYGVDVPGRDGSARAGRPTRRRCGCGRGRRCRRRRRRDAISGGRPCASGRRHDDPRARGRRPAGRAGRARRQVHRAGVEEHRHRGRAEQDDYRRGSRHAGPRNCRKCAPLARFLGRHRPPTPFLPPPRTRDIRNPGPQQPPLQGISARSCRSFRTNRGTCGPRSEDRHCVCGT
jgi:hypothetical protein